MSSAGGLTKEDKHNAKLALTKIFGKPEDDMDHVKFSEDGKDGVKVELDGLRLRGWGDEAKRKLLEETLQEAFKAQTVVAEVSTGGQILQHIIVRNGSYEESVKAIGAIEQKDMDALADKVVDIKAGRDVEQARGAAAGHGY